jgi:RimJ/RimL family protein N-acetyltransferase
LRLALGYEQIVGEWAQARIPHLDLEHLGPFVAMGIIDDTDTIRGAAIFHGYAPQYRGIEISFALDSSRGLSRSIIAGIMSYPFQQLNVVRVTAATPGNKTGARTRRFLEHFGFKREGLARLGFGQFGHAAIYGLTHKDWAHSPFNPASRLSRPVRPPLTALSST